MGIKLAQILLGIDTANISFQGSKVAVDALNTLMIFLKRRYYPKNIQNSSKYITDRTHRVISHLYGVFYRSINFIECGIVPVYCFDGKPDRLKRMISGNEFEYFSKMKQKYEHAMEKGETQKAKRIALDPSFLWENSIREMKNLLFHMGIPIINSPSEGEAQCVQLVKMGICDYAVSTDFDVLALGSTNLLKIKNFKSKKIEGTLYNLENNLKHINLNRFQLVDLSILVGNDYFSGINGIGPKTAVKLLHQFGNLDSILKHMASDNPLVNKIQENLNQDLINKIRRLFVMPEVITKFPEICLVYPKRGGIINLMCLDHNLDRNRVEKGVNRLIRAFNTITESKTDLISKKIFTPV